jgi:hypothetical protein
VIRHESRRFTNNLFRVLLRTKRPIPLETLKERVQLVYRMRIFGHDIIVGVEELERQGKVTCIRERGWIFTNVYTEPSPLYRLAHI